MSKKQIIQLAVLTFSFYLLMFFTISGGPDYFATYWLITFSLLLGIYIIYSPKNSIFIKYLRIALYVVLGYLVYSIVDNVVGLYTFYSDVYFSESHLSILWHLLQDGFNLLYVIMISAALLLNKPSKMIDLRMGKLKIII